MAIEPDKSFVRSLCIGEIEEDLLLPYPQLKPADRETLKGVFSSLDSLLGSKAEQYKAWDKKGEMPASFVDELREFGAFSFIVPEAFGGMGMGSAAYSRTLQEIAKHDGSVAVTVGAHSSIGMRGLLLFGTEAQKQKFFPDLASGKTIAAFCLTEPSAGSDAASIKTNAVRDGDDWVLNGSKIWITNGGIADFFTVFAKTGAKDERGNITAFIVTRDLKGVSNGPHEDKMGLRASSTTTVTFDNVRVPNANVLGEVGKGFKVAMTILNNGRTGLGGGAVGSMKTLIALASKQAKERVQFGKPISEFTLVKQKLAQMAVDCYATESAVNLVAGLMDQGYKDYAVEAAISKVFASEALWRTSDEALQIAAGNGYMTEFPYERLVRDARINRIFEGTNEILRLFIALTAMNDVASELKELQASMRGVFNDPIKGFGVLSEYALRQAGLRTPLKRPKSAFTKIHPALAEIQGMFQEQTKQLATAVDRTLRRYGKNIIGSQLVTRRLADVMVDLFVLAATMSRVTQALADKGEAGASRERDLVRVLAGQVKTRVQQNLDGLDDPNDEPLTALADHLVAQDGYTWDNL
jgi:acyl-CoA dehydrogenase family member 9